MAKSARTQMRYPCVLVVQVDRSPREAYRAELHMFRRWRTAQHARQSLRCATGGGGGDVNKADALLHQLKK